MLIEASFSANLNDETYPKLNINLKDRLGRSALHMAVMHGLDDLVRFLLENGAEPNVEDLEGH